MKIAFAKGLTAFFGVFLFWMGSEPSTTGRKWNLKVLADEILSLASDESSFA